jgi:hypothetical protein
VSGGTLTLASGSGSALGSTSAITLGGGTFANGNFSEGSANTAGVGALNLTAAGSHLDFGTGTVAH